ncbi:MAG: ferritin family protein [Pseudomonadota bacterium]
MDKIEMEKIFSTAIDREIEAYEFYKDVATRIDNKEVKTVFEQLAKEEMGHKDMLESLKNDPTKMMKITPPAADYKVAEATELPPLSTDMKPADAIALAMKKEEAAVEFYRGMAAGAEESSIKDMFENLANMELGHKHRLENVFVEIGYPEVF